MTIITYRNEIMACDGRLTEDNTIFTNNCKKIFRLKNGGLIGAAGTANDEDELISLVNRVRGNVPKVKQLLALQFEFMCLIVKPDKEVWLCEVTKENDKPIAYILKINEPFIAIGSGAPWAMGAMDRGASAEQAVKTAIKFDSQCGGLVTKLRLGDNE